MPLSLADRVRLITNAAIDELDAIIPTAAPQLASEALFAILPGFIDTYSTAAAALAADWYDTEREDQNIAGDFTAVIPELGDPGAEALAGWASDAILTSEHAPDWELFRSRAEGGAQRRIANAARETVMTSSVEDPQARGWKRVTRPGACGFCRLLASRGYTYKSKESSTFGSHDDCHCAAVPGWSDAKPVEVRDFTPSERESTQAQRDAVYKWIKENLPIA